MVVMWERATCWNVDRWRIWSKANWRRLFTDIFSPASYTWTGPENDMPTWDFREDANKSLARPGRKQATATKLGIYSICSRRSSIHFLARCSNFCKPLKKNHVVRPTRSPRQQWPPHRTKYGDLSILSSVQGTGGSLTGPDPENRVGD